MSTLELRSIQFGYVSEQPVLRNLDLSATEGEIVALLGPNGSGKSTLLRLAAGLRAPQLGQARWAGLELSRWERRARARQIAFLPQSVQVLYRYRVRDVVMLGRHPHAAGPFSAPSAEDRDAVGRALEQCDVATLKSRPFDELSGGERQRVLLAAALAQGAALLLLDEPTSSLDIHHQIALLDLLRQLADLGRTVVWATHDLNLAAAYAQRLVLLDGGQIAADGPPAQVLTAERIARVYGPGIWVGPHPGGGDTVSVLPRTPRASAGGRP